MSGVDNKTSQQLQIRPTISSASCVLAKLHGPGGAHCASKDGQVLYARHTDTSHADGFWSKSSRISAGSACLEGWWVGGMVGVVSSVGVGLLGHADPQSLVHNIHGTARLGSQQRSYSIGTCHTLIRGPIQQLRNPEPTRH